MKIQNQLNQSFKIPLTLLYQNDMKKCKHKEKPLFTHN